MVWDSSEVNPFSKSRGSFERIIEWIYPTITAAGAPVTVLQRPAAEPSGELKSIILTDPPYYDAIDYAGLSDFFYVWLKRSIGFLHPDLLQLPLSPKSQQAIMASEKRDPVELERYIKMMTQASESIADSLDPDGVVGVVFAHTRSNSLEYANRGFTERRTCARYILAHRYRTTGARSPGSVKRG